MTSSDAPAVDNFWDREFSLVRNVRAKFSAETISLRTFVEGVRTGRWRDKVTQVRDDLHSKPAKAKRDKLNLHAAKFHGVFTGNGAAGALLDINRWSMIRLLPVLVNYYDISSEV